MFKNKFKIAHIILLTILFTLALVYQLAQHQVEEIPYMYLEF
jgi:hypothetical protein